MGFYMDTCLCFTQITLNKKIPSRDNIPKFLNSERKLCAELFWALSKHVNVEFACKNFKPSKEIESDPIIKEHYKRFKTKKHTSVDKMYNTSIVDDVYKRHKIALYLLENQVQKTNQHQLKVLGSGMVDTDIATTDANTPVIILITVSN